MSSKAKIVKLATALSGGLGSFEFVLTMMTLFRLATENALFYVKGGGGWLSDNDFTNTNQTTGASFSGANNNFNGGWLVGAGIEYAFAPNWTAKVEYDSWL